MRYHWLSLVFLFAVLMLAGCAGTAERVHGDIQAPPPTATTSAATEDILAQKTAAAVREATAASDLKAALAELRAAQAEQKHAKTADDLAKAKDALAKATSDIAAARAERDKNKDDKDALATALTDQRNAETAGSLNRFYALAVLVGALAAFTLYEGSPKIASALGVIAGALVIGPMSVGWAIRHEGLVLGSAALAGSIALIWHYRGRIGNLHNALDHLSTGSVGQMLPEVEHLLAESWLRIRGMTSTVFSRLEALMHIRGLGHVLSPQPKPAGVAPASAATPQQAP